MKYILGIRKKLKLIRLFLSQYHRIAILNKGLAMLAYLVYDTPFRKMELFVNKEETKSKLIKTKANNFFKQYYNNVAFHKHKYSQPTGMSLLFYDLLDYFYGLFYLFFIIFRY